MAKTSNIKFMITVPVLNPRPMEALLKQLQIINEQFTRRVERDYRKVSDKFSHATPSYHKKAPPLPGIPPNGGRAGMYGATWTNNDPVMYYLDVGAVRYFAMTRGYKPLTRPGSGLRTYPHSGGVAGPYLSTPKRIEPRGFTDAVVDRQADWYREKAIWAFRKWGGTLFKGDRTFPA